MNIFPHVAEDSVHLSAAKQLGRILLLLLVVLGCGSLTVASAQIVPPVLPDPPVDGTFLSNFMKPEFFIPIITGDDDVFGGDLTASYDRFFYKIEPGQEILIIGEYPRARYFGVTVYDDHGAIIDALHDAEITPLRLFPRNPYIPGGPAGREDVLYAVTIRVDDEIVTSPLPQCGSTQFDVHANLLDARTRHTGGTLYTAAQSDFSVQFLPFARAFHHDQLENGGGMVGIRKYLADVELPSSQFSLVKPVAFLRDVATGCAYQFSTVPGEFLPPDQWYQFEDVVSTGQPEIHKEREKEMGSVTPFGGRSLANGVQWFGGREYKLHDNPDASFISTIIGINNAPSALNQEERVMRIHVRMPEMPCPDKVCALTGLEDLRYWGLSFTSSNEKTLETLSDLDIVTDQDGYAILIITFGTAVPSYVTPENGYTLLQMTDPEDLGLRFMTLRQIIPNPAFECSTAAVPFRTSEHHPNGGYMGEYLPFVTYPVAAELPEIPPPFIQPDTLCEPPVYWPLPVVFNPRPPDWDSSEEEEETP